MISVLKKLSWKWGPIYCGWCLWFLYCHGLDQSQRRLSWCGTLSKLGNRIPRKNLATPFWAKQLVSFTIFLFFFLSRWLIDWQLSWRDGVGWIYSVGPTAPWARWRWHHANGKEKRHPQLQQALAKCNDSLRYFCGFQYVRYFSSWREKVHFNFQLPRCLFYYLNSFHSAPSHRLCYERVSQQKLHPFCAQN